MNQLTIAICQMINGKIKEDNIRKAREMIDKASKMGADIVVLPEIFNCPYNYKYFRGNAERHPNGETIKMLSNAARENHIYLVGGSIPELDEKDNMYNTSFVFNDEGDLIARHRKVHLFDVDIKNGIRFKESAVFSPGNEITIFDTPWGKAGIAICYDIRFQEQIRIMALKGAKMIFVPAAFNMTTGPAHWELLFRSRALDNQLFMIGASPGRNEKSSYVTYGNSLITNPWGEVVKKIDKEEEILIQTIDLDYIEDIRNQLPSMKNRRPEIYKDK